MSRKPRLVPLEEGVRLAGNNDADSDIWSVDGDFFRFVRTESDPENLNDLHAFLTEIVRNFSSDDSDQKVVEELSGCFCGFPDENGENYDWDDTVSGLFYGVILAAIKNDENRQFLRDQIYLCLQGQESYNLDVPTEEIIRLKSGGMAHEEAFPRLDLNEMAEAVRAVPNNRFVPAAGTGESYSRIKKGDTGSII